MQKIAGSRGRVARTTATKTVETKCRTRRCIRNEATSSKNSDTQWVQIGVITGAHGMRGEVRVKPLTDSAEERFQAGKSSWIQRKTSIFETDTQPTQTEIEYVRSVINKGQMSYLLKLNSISNRDEAEDMKGTTMLVKSNEREQLDRDSEFYVQDLAGLEVRLKTGEGESSDIGTIVDVYDGTGAYDTLDIELNESYVKTCDVKEKKGRKLCVLVPFNREIVPIVNVEEGFCEINPPEGLLETCIYKKKK